MEDTYTYEINEITLEVEYDYSGGDAGDYLNAPEPCVIEINSINHEDIDISSIIDFSIIENIKEEIQIKHN